MGYWEGGETIGSKTLSYEVGVGGRRGIVQYSTASVCGHRPPLGAGWAPGSATVAVPHIETGSQSGLTSPPSRSLCRRFFVWCQFLVIR